MYLQLKSLSQHDSVYLPNPSTMSWMLHKGNFSASLNLDFSFSETGYCTKVKEHSLPNYLPIAGGKQIDLCLFKGY